MEIVKPNIIHLNIDPKIVAFKHDFNGLIDQMISDLNSLKGIIDEPHNEFHKALRNIDWRKLSKEYYYDYDGGHVDCRGLTSKGYDKLAEFENKPIPVHRLLRITTRLRHIASLSERATELINNQ